MNRYVEVNAPWPGRTGRERVWQVVVRGAVRRPRLVKEARLGVRGEHVSGRRRVGDLECRRNLRLDDRDARRAQERHSLGWLLPGTCQVGEIDAHAEELCVEVGQGAHRLVGGLDDASRFGLQPDPDRPARGRAQHSKPEGQLGEQRPRRRDLGRPPWRPPPQRQGGDRAVRLIVGQKVRQHAGEVERVAQATRIGPVRAVHGMFDDWRMEGAVGEAVEGHHLQSSALQVPAKPPAQHVVGGQPAGDRRGKPQPDAQHVDAKLGPDRTGEAVQLSDHSGKVLGRMDVGAVRKVHGGAAGVA